MTDAETRIARDRGEPPPIDLDGIEMRWASEWNESDDGQRRAWRDDIAALIDEIRRLRRVSNGYFEEMVRLGGQRPARDHLNALRSDGVFMDGLTAEGPWWTPPEPVLVALYEAIIAASDLLNLESRE